MADDSILIQIQLGSPTKANINAVTRQIQSALSNVSANVQIQNGRQATQTLQNIKSKTDAATKSTTNFAEAIGLSARRFVAFTSAVAVVGRLTSALSQATREAIKFEREFVKLSQVFDTDVRSLRGLQNSLSDVSKEFGLSATVVAKTSVVLAQSGLTARQTEQAMRTLAKTTLAATFDSIASSTEGAVAIMAQFDTEASKLESQLGAINAVSKRFAVESGDIIEAVRRAGGAFRAAGGNLNEFIALFTSVRSTTRESAETIATGFRTIFARLQRPKTIDFFRELNIELSDGQGNFIGAFEAVRRLSKGLNDLGIKAGSLKFASVVEQLGGIRQVSRVIPLLQKFTKAELARQVAIAGVGSLDADAAKAQATLAQSFARTTENFRALIREITQTGTFQAFVKIALNLANAFIEVARSLKPLIPLIAAFGAIKLGGLVSGALRSGFGGSGGAGGLGKGFKRGGPVPGTGSGDTVPAMLEPGEFVIRKSAVQAFGADRLSGINKYKLGGRASYLGSTISRTYPSLRKRIPKGARYTANVNAVDTSQNDKVLQNFSNDERQMPNWEKFEYAVSKTYPSVGKPAKGNRFLDYPGKPGEAKFMRANAVQRDENKRLGKGNNNITMLAKLIGSGLYARGKRNISAYYTSRPQDFQKKAAGGSISGAGTDTVPALLTPGEFVINKKSAESYGYGNLGKINKYAKGGPVQKFANGGDVGDDFQRATGNVLANAKDGQKHVDTFVDSLGEFAAEFKEGFSGAIQDIKSFESQISQRIKQLQAAGGNEEEIERLKQKKASVSRGRGVQTKTKSGKTAVAVRGGKATQQTVEHEVAHAVDEALGKKSGSGKKASEAQGTFQSDLVEKMKPILEEQLRSQGKSEKEIQYRLKNEEIFADLMSKATPEMRKILVSTTDSAEGMEAIAQAARGAKKKGGRLKGLAGVDQDIYRDSKIGRTDAIIDKVRGDSTSKERGRVQRAKDLAGKNIEEIRTSRFKPKSTNILAGFSGGATKRRRSEEEATRKRQEADAQNASLQNLFGKPSRGRGPGDADKPQKKVNDSVEKVSGTLDSFAVRVASVGVILSQTGLLEPLAKVAGDASNAVGGMIGSFLGGTEGVNAFKDALVGGISQLAIFATALTGLGVNVSGILKKSFVGSGTGGVVSAASGGFSAGGKAAKTAKILETVRGTDKKGQLGRMISSGAAAGAAAAPTGPAAGRFPALTKGIGKASGAIGGFGSAVAAAAGPLLILAGLTFLASKGIQALSDAYFETAAKQKAVEDAIKTGNIEKSQKAAEELADAQQESAAWTIAGAAAAGALAGSLIPIPGIGTAAGAAIGLLGGAAIAAVSNLDDFFYNTRAINVAAAKTAAALNKAAESAKIAEAKNERLFRQNKTGEAFDNIAKETSDSARAIKEARNFVKQARIGGDEEKVEGANKQLASAQEAQQKAITRNLPQVKDLITNTAKQNKGFRSLNDVLDKLPKKQADQIKERIKLDKELNGAAADLEAQLSEAAESGREVAKGLNIEALKKNINDLNAVLANQFTQKSEIREVTGQKTTLADTRANLSAQSDISIRGLQESGSGFKSNVSTAKGLDDLTNTVRNANNALKQTGNELTYVNEAGRAEVKTREEVKKISDTAKIAQQEGIRLTKENAKATLAEIRARNENIKTLNSYVTDFAFSSGKDKREKTRQFGSAQKVAAGVAGRKRVGEVQGVTQADKEASKALFEQFGDIALFGGKTGKEVLGDARVAEFGGSQGIEKLAAKQSAKAVAAGKEPISAKELEHSIRTGTVSATDKMVTDLEALNKSTNDAQLASINLFNDGVNIFAQSVLLMEEIGKQAASEKVQAMAEKLSTDAEQSSEFKKAQKQEEQANKALEERKEYVKGQKKVETELRAATNLDEGVYEEIMAAGGDVDKKTMETVRAQSTGSYGGSSGFAGQRQQETTMAKKYNLTEEQKEKFRSLAGDRKQREARMARGDRSGKETIEEELQDRKAAAQRRQKAIKNKAYDSAGPIEGAYVSGANSLRTDTEASIKAAEDRKRTASLPTIPNQTMPPPSPVTTPVPKDLNKEAEIAKLSAETANKNLQTAQLHQKAAESAPQNATGSLTVLVRGMEDLGSMALSGLDAMLDEIGKVRDEKIRENNRLQGQGVDMTVAGEVRTLGSTS